MFVRTVAPTMEPTSPEEVPVTPAQHAAQYGEAKVFEDADTIAEETHLGPSRPCDFSTCKLYSVIRYPVIVMNICGVYVPSYCICQDVETTCHTDTQRVRANDTKRDRSPTLGTNRAEEGVEMNGCSSKTNSMFFTSAPTLADTAKREDIAHEDVAERMSQRLKNSTVTVEPCGNQRACKNSDRRWWGLAKRAGCVSMFVCHSINSFRYAFILREASRETSQLIFSMAMFFILSTYFYLMAFNSFACRAHFTSFITLARDFEIKFAGFRTNFQRLFRIHGVVFMIGVINQSLNATIFMYGVLHSFGGVSPQMWPFRDLEGGWRVLLALVVGFSVFSAGANQYGANIFRAVITGVVEDEFHGLKKDLETILSRATRVENQDSLPTNSHNGTPSHETSPASALLADQDAPARPRSGKMCLTFTSQVPQKSQEAEREFDIFMDRFRAVSHLLDKGYHLTKHTMAAAYIFGVPTLCVMVYGLVSSTVTRDQWVVLSLNVIVAGAVLAHTTWTLARLGTTAESVCDVVYDADWTRFSHSFLQKMVLFTTMFSKKRFGINVYGLFRIEWSTLLVLGTSLLVYSIIIIQFHLGNPTAICHLGNFTV